MNCSFKTMIKFAAGLGVILAAAYFALPEFRTWILASTPILLALICPVSMLAMMFMMKGRGAAGDRKDEGTGPSPTAANAKARDAAPDKA